MVINFIVKLVILTMTADLDGKLCSGINKLKQKTDYF